MFLCITWCCGEEKRTERKGGGAGGVQLSWKLFNLPHT